MRIGRLAVAFLVPFFSLPINGGVPATTEDSIARTEDVIYGHTYGTALTLDVLRPKAYCGYGIVVIVSGGWSSSRQRIDRGGTGELIRALVHRGYTVFAVVHGSQPKFAIPEIIKDVRRAVRFIRHNAARWQVNPDRLGIAGSSAAGHLALCVGTQPRPGPAGAEDPVDRENSGVQAVACLYPPTDFMNFGGAGVDGVGVGLMQKYHSAFGDGAGTLEEHHKLGRQISPIYWITAEMPPTLIIHGDADPLVPLQQSQSFVRRAHELGANAKLVIKRGGGHGWNEKDAEFGLMADWFDGYLRRITK